MIYSGDTVRLVVYFKNLNMQSVDPDSITLTIYNINQEQIEQITLDDSNRKDVGVYFYDYVVPEDNQEIIYEFKGLDNNNPIIIRDSIKIEFV